MLKIPLVFDADRANADRANADSAHFHDAERQALLLVKGVGPTVIQRLEEIGIADFATLAVSTTEGVCSRVATVLGASCWKNSPQSRAAIAAAIERAQRGV